MSTIQIGRDGLATPSWLMSAANAPAADPWPGGAGYAQVTLQIVTATLGIVLLPVLWTTTTMRECWARRWAFGNVAAAWTGKLPLGSLASWDGPPPPHALSVTTAANATPTP